MSRKQNVIAMAMAVSLFAAMLLVFLRNQLYPLASQETIIILVCLTVAGLVAGTALVFSGRILTAVIIGVLITVFFNHVFDWQAIGIRSRYSVPAGFVIGFALSYFMRANLHTILLAGAGAIIFSSVALKDDDVWMVETKNVADTDRQGTGTLPPVIHIILDEHIGVEGIPRLVKGGHEIRENIKSFYRENGFALYGKAISRFLMSHNSIPDFFNFRGVQTDWQLSNYSSSRGFVIQKNDYFQAVRKKGFDIEVLQTDLMDFCSAGVDIKKCTTIRYKSLGWVAKTKLPTAEKLYIVGSAFLNRATIYQVLEQAYSRLRMRFLDWGLELPSVLTNTASYAPISMIPLFDETIDTANRIKPGTYLLSHIMLPHSPSVFEPNCQLERGAREWTAATIPDRYELYLRQLGCTYTLLRQFMARQAQSDVDPQPIIIIQGDHGSRIHYSEPGLPEELQSFSTLYAIKWPGKTARYIDDNARDISSLLLETVLEPLGIAAPDVSGSANIMRKIGDSDKYDKLPFEGFRPK